MYPNRVRWGTKQHYGLAPVFRGSQWREYSKFTAVLWTGQLRLPASFLGCLRYGFETMDNIFDEIDIVAQNLAPHNGIPYTIHPYNFSTGRLIIGQPYSDVDKEYRWTLSADIVGNVGYAQYSLTQREKGLCLGISFIEIHPLTEVRGNGFFSHAMSELEKLAREHSLNGIALCNVQNRKLVENRDKFGFSMEEDNLVKYFSSPETLK